jgi:hypothetical protein
LSNDALTLVATAAEAPPSLSPGREALRQAIAAVRAVQAAFDEADRPVQACNADARPKRPGHLPSGGRRASG